MSEDLSINQGIGRAAFETISAELAELKSRMDVPAWRNPANAIAALAFALSLFTSGFSIYSGSVKDSHDLENDLATVTEKLAALPLDRADFLARHAAGRKGDPGYLDASHSYDGFQNETSMFAFEGYHLALKLGSSAATPELLEVSGALETINNYSKAIIVLKLALANSDNWYQEFAARNSLEWALLTPPVSARMRADAQKVFDDEKTITERYPALGDNAGEASYQLAYGELKWAEALLRIDCADALPHLRHVVGVYGSGTILPPDGVMDGIEGDLRQCGVVLPPPSPAPRLASPPTAAAAVSHPAASDPRKLAPVPTAPAH